MWWQHLGILDAVAQTGNMAMAAQRLVVNKSTISRRLSQLEQAAPSPLFERRCGRIELTPYGLRALAAFREHESSRERLLSTLEATEPDIHGLVRITAPRFVTSLVIAPALRAFVTQHAKVSLQLEDTHQLLDLTRDEADVALRNVRPTGSSLAARKIGRLGLSAYASARYLASRGEPQAREELSRHDFVTYSSGRFAGSGFEWLVDTARNARVRFSGNDAMTLHDAARADLGIAVLPHIVGDRTPELKRVPVAGDGAMDIWMVTRAEQRKNRRIRAVVQFLSELVAKEQPRLCAPC